MTHAYCGSRSHRSQEIKNVCKTLVTLGKSQQQTCKITCPVNSWQLTFSLNKKNNKTKQFVHLYLHLSMLLSLGRGVPQRPAAAARGALPGSFGLHVHSAGGGGRSAQPQSWPPSGTCQLHVALVLSIFKVVLHLLSTNPNHWKILTNLILEEVRIRLLCH